MIFYLSGVLVAFFVNALHMFVFLKDVAYKQYPLWQQINIFVWSSVIISALSWVGFFFVSVSLGIRIFKD